MITIDTSGMLCLLDRRAPRHTDAVEALRDAEGPFLVPAATLGELGHFLQHRHPPAVARAFLGDLRTGAWALDCGEADFSRVQELNDRYRDLPLGLVDAAVIACAERNGGTVLTFDRDFDIVARERTIAVLPGPVG